MPPTLPRTYPRATIESICQKVTSGGTPLRSNENYWSNGSIPWFKTGELNDGYLTDAEEFITAEALEESSAKMFPANTVLMAMYGDGRTITTLGILRDAATTNQACCAMISDPEVSDFRFFFYALKFHRHELLKLVVAGAQRNLSTGIIRKFPLTTPPLPTQRRIAEILSAYDDLIENNQRRMKLLEESARLLYQEWFVRLRFPGHEHTKIVDGVPEGWERNALSDLCETIDYGFTASADKDPVGPKFLRITDIVPDVIDWSSVPHCEIPDGRLPKFILAEGDIVIARTGATVGYAKRISKCQFDAIFASYLVRIRIKPDTSNLMIGTFVESEEYKKFVMSRINGAAQPNASAKVLASPQVLVPTRKIQLQFNENVQPIVDQRDTLQTENQKLRAACDILLPRLMNGEIEV